MDESPTYLTAAEVAAVLRVTPATVGDLIEAGKLHAYKPGRTWLIKPADLDAYIEAGASVAAAS